MNPVSGTDVEAVRTVIERDLEPLAQSLESVRKELKPAP